MESALTNFYPFYAILPLSDCYRPKTDQEKHDDDEYDRTISNLQKNNAVVLPLHNYQGFWLAQDYLRGLLVARSQFTARESDILLATSPKSGTTWLKALMFSISNRNNDKVNVGKWLGSMSPHQLFPFLEGQYMDRNVVPCMDLVEMCPRMFNTHTPYSLLPESISQRDCKIIYVCREPKDNFVSWWHYSNKIAPKDKTRPSFQQAFELYCNGTFPWGPVWDHMLGYWNDHRRRLEKTLFLKYGDVKKDVVGTIRRVAEFMGSGFTGDEERDRVVEGIAEMCSLKRLREMDINKNGKIGEGHGGVEYKNEVFFRKGEVGDWENHLSDEMVKKIDAITKEKLSGSGLRFS